MLWHQLNYKYNFLHLSRYSHICLIHFTSVSARQRLYDGRSQIKVHTDERTQVYSAQVVTHPSTYRGRRALTSVNVPQSWPLSPPQVYKVT